MRAGSRQASLPRVALLLIGSLALAAATACSTSENIPAAAPPPPLQTEPTPPELPPRNFRAELEFAVQALRSGHYALAQEQFGTLSTAPDISANLRGHALAGLALLYLDHNNPDYSIERASDTLDTLYAKRGDTLEDALLFDALYTALQNALKANEQRTLRWNAEKQGRKLEQEVINLQIALEKLRKLSLQ